MNQDHRQPNPDNAHTEVVPVANIKTKSGVQQGDRVWYDVLTLVQAQQRHLVTAQREVNTRHSACI